MTEALCLQNQGQHSPSKSALDRGKCHSWKTSFTQLVALCDFLHFATQSLLARVMVRFYNSRNCSTLFFNSCHLRLYHMQLFCQWLCISPVTSRQIKVGCGWTLGTRGTAEKPSDALNSVVQHICSRPTNRKFVSWTSWQDSYFKCQMIQMSIL